MASIRSTEATRYNFDEGYDYSSENIREMIRVFNNASIISDGLRCSSLRFILKSKILKHIVIEDVPGVFYQVFSSQKEVVGIENGEIVVKRKKGEHIARGKILRNGVEWDIIKVLPVAKLQLRSIDDNGELCLSIILKSPKTC